MSACFTPDCVPSNTVFMAVDGEEIFFCVVQDSGDVQSRRKEITNEDVKSFIISLNQSIGTRGGVICENRSIDEPCGEQLADERAPGNGFHAVQSQRHALRMLYDVIIAPIADLCEGNDILFVPEGPLCLVPYAALLDSKEKYMCEFFRIRLIPSLATLKLITDCPGDFHEKTGPLLVGDPCLQEVPQYLRKGLDQLPYAKSEVGMIGRILGTAPLTGEKATKDEVLKRLSSVALVHIAAHGRMETGQILLAPSPSTRVRTEKDCLLTMTDVLQANLRAKLVVLSCCHSAEGEIKAEGVVGIARAFLGAGARSVLVSLWVIDDEATMEFMKHFYGELVKAKKASEALHRAINCIRESQQFREVDYWAPFVLIGDDVTLEFLIDGFDRPMPPTALPPSSLGHMHVIAPGVKPASSSLLSPIYGALKAPSPSAIISPALRKILCTVSPAADAPISTWAKLGEVSGVALVSICEAYATTPLDFLWHNISTPPVTVLQISRCEVCVCVEVPTSSANNWK
ncbi:Tetratricopeptide repeat protein 28 [Acropora cervicornis]|uniref:Tetratricopeptide repeat protein 28 n=1 Tax=Acropora cervicornis TaxID=6130 RepID=A0AAD9QSH9_ACRCE|nr:Tetratricopeptide repeat protein 28 [Acropora cervicornis]